MARPAGLILDYGNVLTRSQDQTWMDKAAERLGASVPAFRSAFWRYRHDYEADLPAHEYWRRVIAAARPTGDGPTSDPDLRWLIEAAVASWVDYHAEVWALGLPPHEARFVDDRLDNIEAATRVGLRTLQFEGADALDRLRALIR